MTVDVHLYIQVSHPNSEHPDYMTRNASKSSKRHQKAINASKSNNKDYKRMEGTSICVSFSVEHDGHSSRWIHILDSSISDLPGTNGPGNGSARRARSRTPVATPELSQGQGLKFILFLPFLSLQISIVYILIPFCSIVQSFCIPV